MIELNEHQEKAARQMKNGSILCGGVGSGKSRAALAYYLRVCKKKKDLYIITTAKKRDSLEWEDECSRFYLSKEREYSRDHLKVTVDSWNNIKKYKDVFGAFFIFDEQRLVGSGVWVKTFLNISRKNQWILLSATPGDQWSDYIPVFIANGFYRNKTEFISRHCVYARFSKYPKIEKYIGLKELEQHRKDILVELPDDRNTVRHMIVKKADFNREMYRMILRDRWNPYENCPIEETGKLCYLLRKVVNSDISRIDIINKIVKDKKYCLVFYNFDYELEILIQFCKDNNIKYRQLNGHKHDNLPVGGKSWLYLIQYASGCEGWNCITSDTVIFFSDNYSYRVMEQASGRIDRMNTPFRNLYYYHIRSNAPIDLAIARKLKDKKNFNENAFLGRRK